MHQKVVYAVMLTLRQPFDLESNKAIVLVTDAPPHIFDKETKNIEEVLTAIQTIEVEQFYLVIATQDVESQVNLKLLFGVKGMAFDLGEGDDFRIRYKNFKQILMSLRKTISTATRSPQLNTDNETLKYYVFRKHSAINY
ncbi:MULTISPECIES: hypothetical protein [unclassified Okeania]|uniref:hypothetical protein n=1 Tax=unclassified Okeania TaxID=2634635 RepID=UPI00257E3F71|nr:MULTISPECIES: hypothetical protein [unclassified Okeania]